MEVSFFDISCLRVGNRSARIALKKQECYEVFVGASQIKIDCYSESFRNQEIADSPDALYSRIAK